MKDTVCIVSTGARTPLGLGAAASAAAFRAGVSAVGRHPFLVDLAGDMMPGALDTGIDAAQLGAARMEVLAEAALREACLVFSGLPPPRMQVPVFLALPEVRPGFAERDAAAVRKHLASVEGLPVDISQVHVSTQGHACGLAALALARDRIAQGAFEACIVGGVDSYFEPETMEWLDQNRQLTGSISRSSFVPGEAAAFCVVMSARACQAAGLQAQAGVIDVSLAQETRLIKTADTCLGEGLTTAVSAALGEPSGSAQLVTDVICDINGERYRGEEWGFVCLRLSQRFDDPTAYWSPAECWGDVGAASGPLFAVLACEAAARGYAKGTRALLWASSERGLRGAALLELPMRGPAQEGRRHA